MKTFAFTAIAAFAVFLLTAVYLLRGAVSPHVVQTARPPDRPTTAVESRPRGKAVHLASTPHTTQPADIGAVVDVAENAAVGMPGPTRRARSAVAKAMELRYADLRSEAGFTDSEFEQFIDLKVSQELNPLAPNNDRIEADEEAAGREAEERDELLARFGAEKTARLRQFEKTLPARAEVGELRDLLEREALGVTAAQRSAMIKAAIASGAGMPLRKISDAESNTAVYQEILALQELSDQRMRSSARGILSGAQMQAYEAFLMDRRDSLEDTIRNVAEEERSDK